MKYRLRIALSCKKRRRYIFYIIQLNIILIIFKWDNQRRTQNHFIPKTSKYVPFKRIFPSSCAFFKIFQVRKNDKAKFIYITELQLVIKSP